ncbi:MAG TPA: TolC family protein [Longimicrobiaceae bacterium]|nr:TolC family protein [Longimicrobiaceae bacterium]
MAVLGSVLTPSTTVAQAGERTLSLREAIEAARSANPDFLAQRNQLGSAAWQVRSAYGSLVPSVNASNSIGYTATGERRFDSVVLDRQPEIYSSRYSLGMSLSLNGSTLLAPSVARAQERATVQQVEGAAANLEANVTQRYLTVREARDGVAQAEREVTRVTEHLRLAEARLEVGAGTQLDVRRAEVQHGQAEVRLLQAQNTAANELLLLGQVVGSRLPNDVVLTEHFDLFEPVWQVEQLIGVARAENPQLRASRAQADAAGTRAKAARSMYLPTVSLSAGLSGYVSQAATVDPMISQELQRAGSIYNQCLQQNEIRGAVGLPTAPCADPGLPGVEAQIRDRLMAENRGFPFDYIRQPASASITVSIPVFTGLNRQLQVEEARVARLNAEHEVRAQELQLEVDVETALRNLQTAYRAALLQQRIRDTAEQELALAQERFRLGLATSIEIVDAQANLAEAERAEIAAVYDFHRSLAALEARLGEPLDR